jgi:hypothetical protein
MKSRFLFPHRYHLIGYFFILAYIPLMVVKKILHNGYNNQDPAAKFADNSGLLNSEHVFTASAIVLIILGLLFIAFAKEKIEDEQIMQLRLDSLQWATYLNYFLIIICVVFSSNLHLRDMMVINIWMPLIFFITRFKWRLYKLTRLLNPEII